MDSVTQNLLRETNRLLEQVLAEVRALRVNAGIDPPIEEKKKGLFR